MILPPKRRRHPTRFDTEAAMCIGRFLTAITHIDTRDINYLALVTVMVDRVTKNGLPTPTGSKLVATGGIFLSPVTNQSVSGQAISPYGKERITQALTGSAIGWEYRGVSPACIAEAGGDHRHDLRPVITVYIYGWTISG
jgi:hypothetical protein